MTAPGLMLWFPDMKEVPSRVRVAAKAYRDKFGVDPNYAEGHRADIGDTSIPLDMNGYEITLVPARHIRRNHIWITRKDTK